MRESVIESYLVEQVERAGGIAEKVVSLSGRGFFDRLVILDGGIVAFVEVKRPKGGRLAPQQASRAERYRALGCICAVVRTKPEADELIERLRRRRT